MCYLRVLHVGALSSNNYLIIPKVVCANLRLITKAKHAELLQQSAGYDLIMISESWLKPHKRNAFNIPGFKLLTGDRTTKRAGVVCMCIRDTLSTTVTDTYTSQDVSTMWVALQQPKQPTIKYVSIYHPPGLKRAVCDNTINHVVITVSQLYRRCPASKFVIYGDLNDLQMTRVSDVLPLKQIVQFPTRGNNMLDLVFTDIDWYTIKPELRCQKSASIGRSDHCSIILSSTSQWHSKSSL